MIDHGRVNSRARTLALVPRVSAVLLSLLAACGGGQRASAPASNHSTATPGELPPAYAGLFVARELSFPAELVISMYGDHGPEQTSTKGTVACTISDVRAVADGKAMTLACSSALDLPDSPAGTYVGTSQGLWRVTDGDVTKLDPARRLLPAQPVAARIEHKDPDPDMEAGDAIIVEAHGKDWCVTLASFGGDEGGWTMCVREGAGLVGGHGYFAGGSSRDLYFGDVKRN